MAIDKSTDLWPWYKEILATVEAALVHKHPESRAKLEMVLKDAENDFKNLLQKLHFWSKMAEKCLWLSS